MSLTTDLVRIVQDDETQRLAALLDRFNPFDVLRIGHYELRHTNTLAWLLDPAGNHGLGEAFLRAVVHRLDAQQDGMSLAERFETAADRTVTVRREVALSKLRAAAPEAERLGVDDGPESEEVTPASGKRTRAARDGAIDILLEGDGWILAIEAKVRSSEANEQLPRYREALAAYTGGDEAAARVCFHVFLTVDGDDPSDAAWQVATWREHVADPLSAMLAIRPELQTDVRRFLESYLETLRRHAGDGGAAETLAAAVGQRFTAELRRVQSALRSTPNKQALEPGAERLVRRHAALLRLLLDALVSPQGARAAQIQQVLRDHHFTPLPGAASYMRFMPASWSALFPAMLAGDGPQVVFEVVNRTPTALVKLLVPGLGQDARDAFAPARRELVARIQASGRVDAFPKAFYATRPGEAPRPRPPTDQFFSVYTRSQTLDEDDEAPDALNSFVQFCAQDIQANVLPELQRLMQASGLR